MMQTPDPQQRLSAELTSTSYINFSTDIHLDIILVCFKDVRSAVKLCCQITGLVIMKFFELIGKKPYNIHQLKK